MLPTGAPEVSAGPCAQTLSGGSAAEMERAPCILSHLTLPCLAWAWAPVQLVGVC